MSVPRQALRVFLKDVRRFWPALVGLGTVVAVYRSGGLELAADRVAGLPFPQAIFPAAFALLAAAVVQDDPVASDRAFWRGTPLRPEAVLLAKVAFLGLFLCVVPSLVQVEWITSLAGGGPTGRLFAHSMLYQGGLLALAALGAALTPGLGSWAVLALVASVGVAAISQLVVGPLVWTIDPAVPATLAYASRWSWLAIGCLLLAHQYRTGKTGRTGVLAAVALGLSTVALAAWTPTSSRRVVDPRDRASYRGSDAVRLKPQQLRLESSAGPDGPVEVLFVADIRIEAGDSLSVVAAVQGTTFRSGDRRRSYGPVASRLHRPPSRRIGRDAPALSGMTQLGLRPPSVFPEMLPLALGSYEQIDALRDSDRLELTVDVHVFRPHVAAALPPRERASATVADGAVVVTTVVRSDRSMFVVASGTTVSTALDAVGPRPGLAGRGSLVLANPRRGEYLVASGSGYGQSQPGTAPQSWLVGGSALQHTAARWEFTAEIAGRDRARLPDDWFDDTELLLVGTSYLGSFERTLEIEIPEWPQMEGPPVRIDGGAPPGPSGARSERIRSPR